MLRMVQLRSADEAKRYYQGAAKSRGDYYAEQELTGRWGGVGATMLGLKGQVEREQFELLCDNLHPVTGEQLTARTRDDRTVGYDLSFHCPKSVSSVLAVTGDQELIAAFRESVDETMREIERQGETRVRLDRLDDNRETGNLVWAEFIHHTARPVAGTPDPHLHSHCVVFNATWDKVESRWKAGQFRGIKRDAPYFEAAFHSRMANRVRELGYAVRRTSNRVGGWEIVGVPQPVIDRFSRRTEEIEKLASELGVTDPEKKSELGAKTRRGKARDQSMTELRRDWDSRLTDPERESIQNCRGRSPAPPPPDGPADAGRALDHAATHLFERESVVSEKRLVGEALRFGVGSLSVGDAWKGLDHAGGRFLRGSGDGQKLVTTPEVLAEEKAMIAFAKDGRGQCRPLREPGRCPPPATQLNRQQRAAVDHILDSPDRVILLRGGAGTGKTTLMREAINGIEAGGKKVFTFAPTGDAARRVLREEAGFKDAETVASLLVRSRPEQALTGNVIWVDEAGQLGTRAMHSLFQVAERYQCRIVLSGDTKQHGSVERGDALRLLETQAGCKPAEVREILRQRGAYKEAVAAAERGNLDSCFGHLQKMGSVHQVAPEEAHHRIARDYVAARKAGKSALVVSPTHREGERVNAAIRESLKDSGELGQEERKFTRLVNLSLTEGERSDWRRYEAGQVVQFVQNAPGFRRGERLGTKSDGMRHGTTAREHNCTIAGPWRRRDCKRSRRCSSRARSSGGRQQPRGGSSRCGSGARSYSSIWRRSTARCGRWPPPRDRTGWAVEAGLAGRGRRTTPTWRRRSQCS